MEDITLKQFLFTQPEPESPSATDKDYLRIANRLLHTWRNRALMQDVPDDLKKVVCIGLVGYYQDLISDAGVWRTFIDECKRRYGFRVPFHEDSPDYIDYELNREDVEFMLWYLLAFNSMSHRFLYPLDNKLLTLADALYKVLDEEYDTVPDPEDYDKFFKAELHNSEDAADIHDLSQWLFWKNWLLLPPFQLTFAQIYSGWVEIQQNSPSPQVATERIDAEKQQAMAELPTGPLALYLKEWLSLLLTGKLPQKKRKSEEKPEPHPWYTKFVEATGCDIIFIKDYKALNNFLIEKLGWEPGEEHLSQLKNHEYFVLMVTAHSGLMVAKDIARCIKHPLNPYYDSEYARDFAFSLLSQRGKCPGDMLRRLIAEEALPDARFPESDDTSLVTRHADLLARAYLQEFYRADL